MCPDFSKDTYLFKDIQKLGLYPDVTDLEVYKQRVEVGLVGAHIWLDTQNALFDIGPDKIKETHRLAFDRVHPWAGTFRGREKQVRVGPYIAAEPECIPVELTAAKAQMDFILGHEVRDPNTGTDLAGYAAVALFHSRFERIHPFRDGNGRTGRVVLFSQVKQLTGKEMRFPERDIYLAAIRATDKGHLTPMINVIRTGIGEARINCVVDSPFRVAPKFLEAMGDSPPTVEEIIEHSRRPR